MPELWNLLITEVRGARRLENDLLLLRCMMRLIWSINIVKLWLRIDQRRFGTVRDLRCGESGLGRWCVLLLGRLIAEDFIGIQVGLV